MFEILKHEGRSIINQFENETLILLLQEDIFGLYIRMDYLVLMKQVQGLGNFVDQALQKVSRLP